MIEELTAHTLQGRDLPGAKLYHGDELSPDFSQRNGVALILV
jgi:hypothetical protein